MKTVRSGMELLLNAMGWQERVAGQIGSQKQGWLPPGGHDGQPLVVDLERDAELPEGALLLAEAFSAGVVQPLFGIDGRHFLLDVAPGVDGSGTDCLTLTATCVPAGADPASLPEDVFRARLMLGWGMNHGLLRETLIGWVTDVLVKAPSPPPEGAVEEIPDPRMRDPYEPDPQFLHELRTLCGKYGAGGVRQALDMGLGEWPAVPVDSAREEAQRILDRGGRGAKSAALRTLGLRV